MLMALPLLGCAQNVTKDTTPNIGEYFISNLCETPYDTSLLVNVPNTKVSLIPPEHFIFVDKIPGYIHPGTSSSIQVKEIKGTSWPILDKAMTPEHFESQGVKFISRQEITLHSGLTGVMYTLSFNSKGAEFERIMLFAGDYDYTIWLNANYPVLLKKTIFKPLTNCLMSANIYRGKHEKPN